uniref:Uncharacterized protein n=1 Tax=Rhizophora mucronata TaxID=61149 RepID=A0A2P2PP23_RHIMU
MPFNPILLIGYSLQQQTCIENKIFIQMDSLHVSLLVLAETKK